MLRIVMSRFAETFYCRILLLCFVVMFCRLAALSTCFSLSSLAVTVYCSDLKSCFDASHCDVEVRRNVLLSYIAIVFRCHVLLSGCAVDLFLSLEFSCHGLLF